MPHHDAMSLSTEPLSSQPKVTVEQLGMPPYVDRRCELVDGGIVDVTPAHGGHGRLAGRVLRAVVLWAEQHDAGEVLSADTGFVLRRDPDTVRAPDVAFVRKGRPVPDHAFIEGAPDVAIEVLSRDVSMREVTRKVRDYLGAGASQVWILDPEDRTLTVHSPGGHSLALGADGTLEGGEVLPGFRLELRTIFAP